MTPEEVDAILYNDAVVYRLPHDRSTLAIGYVVSFSDGAGAVLLRPTGRFDDECRVPCSDVLQTCPDPESLLRTE